MTVDIRLITDDEKPYQARLCKDQELFVRGWSLSRDLDNICLGNGDYLLAIAEINGEPIACATLDKEIANTVNVYVKTSERRKGIGSALINVLAQKVDRYCMTAREGIPGSAMFYDKVGIFRPEERCHP